MAGEDQLTLSNGTTPETMTIIPTNGKVTTNGNGIHKQQDNNNGTNGKESEVIMVENGKTNVIDEKSIDYYDDETTCGWGPFKPRWLQRLATKQMFLVIFCATWVNFGKYRGDIYYN